MTPIDLSVKGLENQTAICFRKVFGEDIPLKQPRIPYISVTGPNSHHTSNSFEDSSGQQSVYARYFCMVLNRQKSESFRQVMTIDFQFSIQAS